MNKVILIGNLGKPIEVKQFPNGGAVGNTVLATTETWTDKDTKERKEETTWHNLVFNGKQALNAAAYTQKGSKLAIEGRIKTRKWTDKDNQDHYVTEIRVDTFEFLSRKGEGTTQEGEAPDAQSGTPAPKSGAPDFEDDIPF